MPTTTDCQFLCSLLANFAMPPGFEFRDVMVAVLVFAPVSDVELEAAVCALAVAADLLRVPGVSVAVDLAKP